jgi:hypothetical protein
MPADHLSFDLRFLHGRANDLSKDHVGTQGFSPFSLSDGNRKSVSADRATPLANRAGPSTPQDARETEQSGLFFD